MPFLTKYDQEGDRFLLMQVEEGPWLKFEHDLDAMVRLQNVMLAAAEGGRMFNPANQQSKAELVD
tara:strand:- start:136 stop:330 length:195 start_codon:yes stop_codon:yes gene_type:complete